jgi:hypothetical protein
MYVLLNIHTSHQFIEGIHHSLQQEMNPKFLGLVLYGFWSERVSSTYYAQPKSGQSQCPHSPTMSTYVYDMIDFDTRHKARAMIMK